MFASMPMMVISGTWWVPFHSVNYVKKLENGRLQVSFRTNEKEGLSLTVAEDEIAYALFPQPKDASQQRSDIVIPRSKFGG